MVSTSETSEFAVRTLPAGAVAYQTFSGTIPSIEPVISSVRSWVVTMGYKPEGPVAVEIHGKPWEDPTSEFDFEVQLPVGSNAKADPSDRVQIKTFEPTRAVVMTMYGASDIANLSDPLGRMIDWMREHNHQPTREVVRWVEVTDPTKVSIEEQTTELQYLI